MIAINLKTGAVSEYTGCEFQSIAPTHAGNALGLYALGGDSDAGEKIVGHIQTPRTVVGDTLKHRMDSVYATVLGSGVADVEVLGQRSAWSYCAPLRPSGESRWVVGKGIRENLLGFGFKKTDGGDFKLDRVEVRTVPAKFRRI